MDVPIRKGALPEEYMNLSNDFEGVFHQPPDFFVKTPGRVNLIGEHIDYCGFPVLPMAIQQNIKLAIKVTQDGILHLLNVNKKYQPFKCAINTVGSTVLNDGTPDWYKYFLCGVKGALDELLSNSQSSSLNGMMVLVSGNIPPASGLSSSSALVSASVLGISYANGLSMDKQRLASVAARCERHIGTEGGGMDQAIAFLGAENTAQYIEWNPLRSKAINLPKHALFVIANSLSEANKAASSDFNQRVVECRLGCRMMAKTAALNWRTVEKFAVLQQMLNFTLEEMENLAKECIKKESYTKADLMEVFGISEPELRDTLLTPNTQSIETFHVRRRALHVFQEAQRVEEYRKAAEANDLKAMSILMRESHRSLAELYECSHKNLDELVRIADSVGEVGARLTGAGWGGCIIALCSNQNKADQFISELRAKYYSKLEGQSLDNVVFISSSQSGAEVLVN